MSTRPDAHVLIVGGGATGGGLAHDLALRGVRVTLVERGELTSGTSGRHHGLLHSGARYAVGDREAGLECIQENMILKRIAPGTFEACFLLAVTIHAMLGIRGILHDRDLSARAARRLDKTLWTVGTLTVGYGMALLIILAARS